MVINAGESNNNHRDFPVSAGREGWVENDIVEKIKNSCNTPPLFKKKPKVPPMINVPENPRAAIKAA